jgi:beta-glucosidase
MKKTEELLKELTAGEKAALLEGYNSWMTNAVPRLGIPSVSLTDGPLGVRRKADSDGEGMTGLGKSCPSTAFPCPAAIADSWDPENAERMGKAIGEECAAYGVDVLLGPALNLKRDPRCGRNFEYFSEDPLLSGKMAASYTRGIQESGTAACPKHFALNNCENHRYMGDSVADERTIRELYLRGFEICVREGKPRTIMCAYNKINGIHCSENKKLLTDILRKEWKFDGLAMSDWGATRDRVAGVKAGLDLDMPGGIHANRNAILEALKNGSLSAETLDTSVRRVLTLISDAQKTVRKPETIDALLKKHSMLAEQIAEECAVLLKNDGILPLDRNKKVLVTGELFEKMRCQGAGSSGLNPAYLTSPKAAFDRAGVPYEYVQGYREASGETDENLKNSALRTAADYDTILFFGGLTDSYESEGFDREDLSMPRNQLELIDALCRAGKKVAVVLSGGSPMEVPFADQAAGILNMVLPGEEGGEACRRLLYGEVNPCGKLSETWMKTCGDIPFGEKYSKGKIEQYREGIFAGYRYFDKAPEKIRYPFGFGLSYTEFEYSSLEIRQEENRIIVSVRIRNKGSVAGREIVQLYSGRNENSAVFKPEKELRYYAKISLKPGEEKTAELSFPESDLAYYHAGIRDWVVENGTYPILVGASSRDIRLTGKAVLSGYPAAEPPYSEAVCDAYEHIAGGTISDAVFSELLAHRIPPEPPVTPYTIESPIGDYRTTGMGRVIYRSIMKGVVGSSRKIAAMPEGEDKDAMVKNQDFVLNLIPRNSTRAMIQMGGGRLQMNMAYAITDLANGHLLRAASEFMKKEKSQPLPCEDKGGSSDD